MTPYREVARPTPLVLRVVFVPGWTVIVAALFAATAVLAAHFFAREVFVGCKRSDGTSAWTCEVHEWRGVVMTSARHSVIVEVPQTNASGVGPEPIVLKALEDGGGAAWAGDRELARFSLREVERAQLAVRALSRDLLESGNKLTTASVSVPPGDALGVWAAMPVLALAALWLFFRPSSFAIDPSDRLLHIELRSSPFSRTSMTTKLAKVVSVTPGPDLEVSIKLTDGTIHRVSPVGWNTRQTARFARRLREAISPEVDAPIEDEVCGPVEHAG